MTSLGFRDVVTNAPIVLAAAVALGACGESRESTKARDAGFERSIRADARAEGASGGAGASDGIFAGADGAAGSAGAGGAGGNAPDPGPSAYGCDEPCIPGVTRRCPFQGWQSCRCDGIGWSACHVSGTGAACALGCPEPCMPGETRPCPGACPGTQQCDCDGSVWLDCYGGNETMPCGSAGSPG